MAYNEKSKENLAPPWQPGESGNPGGRPKAPKEAAEALSDKAFRALSDVLDGDFAPSKVAAAKEVLARAWGNVPQKVAGDASEPLQINVNVRYEGDPASS
jgi:uncharacterized protein DUF5681